MANQANREGRRDNGSSRNWNEMDRDDDMRGDDDRNSYGGRDEQSRGESRGARQYGEDRNYGGSSDDDRSYGQGGRAGGGSGEYGQGGRQSSQGREQGRDQSRDQNREGGGYGQYSRGNDQSGGQYGRFGQAGYGDYGQSGPKQWSQAEDSADYGSSAGQYMRDTRAKPGPHFGKGPKNYTRTDDRLREDANDRLMQDHDLDATHIEVQVKDGEITLSGTVEQRSDKRRAEDVVENIAGVKHVQNNIRVSDANDNASAKKAKAASSTAS